MQRNLNKDYDTNMLAVDDLQPDFTQIESQKREIDKIMQSKFSNLQNEVQSMLNNFHVEIIRQFEIQKVSNNNTT